MIVVSTYESIHSSLVFYSSGIVRISHKEGVQLTASDVEENLKIIDEKCNKHPPILIDHRHSYSLDFSAQQIIQNFDFFPAIAILVSEFKRMKLAEMIVSVMKTKCRCELFTDEGEAIRWLEGLFLDDSSRL